MNDKIKILLGENDIVIRDNEDLFVNINLNRTFNEYKKEKYDNDFDLALQFKKERDLSRNFRVYGMIESNVIDTSNMLIKVYSDSGATKLISSVVTTPLGFSDNMNIFKKKRGKYYISLDNYQEKSIYIQTPSNDDNISTQLFEQKLVFYDYDNEFIPYGTETVEINDDLEVIEINNNFPFFYNKHWIKNNINLQETKYPIVSFSGSSQIVLESQLTEIVVFLDKPSPFGKEKVDFVFGSGTANNSDFITYLNNPLNSFEGSTTLSFQKGQQYKKVFFSASTNVETLEDFTFKLENFKKVKSGSSLVYRMEIQNGLERKFANFELTNLFENRVPFVGLTASTETPETFYSAPSVLRNGLYYNQYQNEFYPIDEVAVEITNLSNGTTILPSNSGFGNALDELWPPGASKTFTITPTYSNVEKNIVEITLPPYLNMISVGNQTLSMEDSARYVIENISINGLRMTYISAAYIIPLEVSENQSISYESIKAILNDGLFDIYRINKVHKPFIASFDDASYKITLTPKSSGTRLDVNTNINKETNINAVATSTIINSYKYPTQNPFNFTLLGNTNKGEVASYRFEFKKDGYKKLTVNSDVSTSISGQKKYLFTSLTDVLHNWDVANNRPIAFDGNPMQGNFLENTYFLQKSEIFYQGIALLNNTTSLNQNVKNLTKYGSTEFTYEISSDEPKIVDSARWFDFPLDVILSTKNTISSTDASQVILLRINTKESSNPIENFYSFDFRVGENSEFTTFYWNGNNNAGDLFNNGSGLKISGNTQLSRTSPGLKYEFDLGGTFNSLVLPKGSLNAQYPGFKSYFVESNKFYSPYAPTKNSSNNVQYQNGGTLEILLSAKIPGTYFEITNIVNNNSNSEIIAMFVSYNEKDGITQNPYNNKMGGFSVGLI